jgi:hypothetical protein
MTSLQTRIAQIPGRVRFFATIGDADTFTPNGSEVSVMTSAQFPADRADDETAGLLRDMGKSVTVIDPNTKQQVAIYRLVQQQVDSINASEGSEGAVFYVKVWDSNGTGVRVARTG